MVVGEMPEAVDLVILGAGPGGYTAALRAAENGRSVTLIDRQGAAGVGGVCLLEGCIPSKALIELSTMKEGVVSASRTMGLEVRGDPRVDLNVFQTWKKQVVATLGNGVRAQLKKLGVETIEGTASFGGPDVVRIEHEDRPPKLLQFEHAIIATGSRASYPSIFDAADERVVDAAGLLEITNLPARVLVVGGGYIGVELGTALQKLGSHVTLVERETGILPGMDSRLGKVLERAMTRLGARVITGASIVAVTDDGVELEAAEERIILEPLELIVLATGRIPNTENLMLERAGLEVAPSGHIVVDKHCRASERIAAIGDVVAGPGLAHKASYEARIAVDVLGGRLVRTDQFIPLVVFSDPEVSAVGLTRDEAREEGYDPQEVSLPFAFVGKSAILQKPEGTVRLVFDSKARTLLGGSIVGARATELIAELTLAVEAGLTVDDVALTVHSHPTLSEVIAEAALLAEQ